MAHQKVLFELEQDDEGYPPINVEGVWAEEIGDGRYMIDNIPFFARSATLGDVITVRQFRDEMFYESTQERSGNSLLRVAFFDGRDPSALRSQLTKLGCSTELSHLQSLIAVNVPPTVKLKDVQDVLNEGAGNGCWDYEEAILRQ